MRKNRLRPDLTKPLSEALSPQKGLL